MREIKFRVWNKDNKEMTNDIKVGERRLLLFDKDILMQYTGLKDKNGKEIYEGDLCQVVFKDNSKYELPCEVYFENGAFCIGSGYLQDAKELNVVSNIYENLYY